jgi:hypothetical protein
MFVLERKTWKIIEFAVTRTGSSKYQFIFPLSYATPATLMEITTPGESLYRQLPSWAGKGKLAAMFVRKIHTKVIRL